MKLILHEQTKEIKTWKNNFQNIYRLFLNPPKENKKEEKEMAGAFFTALDTLVDIRIL